MIPVNILNPFLKVKNYIQDKNGNWKPQKEPTLKHARNISQDVIASTDIVAFEEWDKKVIIDTFEFSIIGDLSYVHAVLNVDKNAITNNFDNQLFYTINPSGSRWFATPLRLANDGNSYFEVLAYDSSANQSKFNLKAPIILPSGGRLAFRPDMPNYVGGAKVTYRVTYRVFE